MRTKKLCTDLPLGLPSSHRAHGLANWGFKCGCSLCTAPQEVKDKSDRQRERLAQIMQAFQDENVQYDQVVALTKEFLHLAKTERLTRKLDGYYFMLMRLYHSFRDLDSSLKYGKLALKYAIAFDDPDGPFLQGLKQDITDLESIREYYSQQQNV
jgi:hypothetical protein